MAELPVLQSPLLAALPGIRHAFFTRQGGVSSGVYDSLNVGRGSKDDPDDVAENRRRAAAHFGAEPDALLTCYQIHSARAVIAGPSPSTAHPREGGDPGFFSSSRTSGGNAKKSLGPRLRGDERDLNDGAPLEGDAVVTLTPDLVCGALAADCAPILIADAEARIVASAHAGWKGALGGIVAAAVEAMIKLGAKPEHMVAAVGPCIGPDSYEVGADFLERFTARDPAHARFFRPGAAPDKRLFDLPGFVLGRLADAGVATAEWIGHDTFAEAELFYSNRRAFHRGDPDYGRLLSAIMLSRNP